MVVSLLVEAVKQGRRGWSVGRVASLPGEGVKQQRSGRSVAMVSSTPVKKAKQGRREPVGEGDVIAGGGGKERKERAE